MRGTRTYSSGQGEKMENDPIVDSKPLMEKCGLTGEVWTKKTCLSLDQHVELGRCMRMAVDKLVPYICGIKPKTLMRKSREAKIIKSLNEARCLLDDVLFRDYGGAEQAIKRGCGLDLTDVYYGDAGRTNASNQRA